ncbi:MAG: recombinase family protein [Alphaproteobacteria bacterium]
MRKEGKWAHKAPVGYKNVKDSKGNSDIIVDPDRGFFITALFKEYASGIYTLEQITKKAREIGFTMPKCKKLYKQTIRNILTNRFYAGEMYGKGDYYAHQYKTLIDWKTFNRCQEILEGRINHKEQKHEQLFKGIMKCQKCGAMISPYISIHPAKKKGGEKIAYKYLFAPNARGHM